MFNSFSQTLPYTKKVGNGFCLSHWWEMLSKKTFFTPPPPHPPDTTFEETRLGEKIPKHRWKNKTLVTVLETMMNVKRLKELGSSLWSEQWSTLPWSDGKRQKEIRSKGGVRKYFEQLSIPWLGCNYDIYAAIGLASLDVLGLLGLQTYLHSF